jgi:hypothetical protein
MMNKNAGCEDLVKALQGEYGDLDAHLEVTSEAELKAEITSLLEANCIPDMPTRDEIAMRIAHKLESQDFRNPSTTVNRAQSCYNFADEMIRLSKTEPE